MNLGRLSELKKDAYRIRIQIDTIWKSLINSPDPMDQRLKYIDSLEVKRLKINVADIERKKKELDDVMAEIAGLKAELGSEDVD